MLDHEQAAIAAQYRPKPIEGESNNNNNNKPSASRRHSSIVQSVHLTVQDIRRYSTLDPKGKRKVTGNGAPGLHPNSVHVHQGQDNNNDNHNNTEPDAVAFIAAMENIHFRTLEGYYCWMQARGKVWHWCSKVPNFTILQTYMKENKGFKELYAESLLFRVMASISEHVLHCPERLAYVYHQVCQLIPQIDI
jgi:hypothetical protein